MQKLFVCILMQALELKPDHIKYGIKIVVPPCL